MYQNSITGLICELESELREQLKQEALNDYWASLKERVKENYQKNKDIYFKYKNDRKSLITLLKTVQDIRHIPDCGKLADELLNIEITSKKNRTQKKVKLFAERLKELVQPKITINKIDSNEFRRELGNAYKIKIESWFFDNSKIPLLDIVFGDKAVTQNLIRLVNIALERYRPSGYYPILHTIIEILGTKQKDKFIEFIVVTKKE